MPAGTSTEKAQLHYTLRGLDGKVLREFILADHGENRSGMPPSPWIWGKDYVYRGGQLLASVMPSIGVRYVASDHLGSPRLATDRCKVTCGAHSYFGFGQEAYAEASDTERMKFTGHERDLQGTPADTGDDLDYMHARYYSPSFGRFLSVDPGWDLSVARKRPQTWNRYTYVASNPMNLVDPRGAFIELISEEGQRTFYNAVTGAMAPGAAKHLKWQKNRLTLVGMSAWAFSKMYGLVGRQLAYLIQSPQPFNVEIGNSALTAQFKGSGFKPYDSGGGLIAVDPSRFVDRKLGGVRVDVAEMLVHEMAHAVGTLIPGVQDRFSYLVGPAVPKPEGYGMAVENEYRRSVLGFGSRDIRAWYLTEGDSMDAGPGAEIFP